MKQKYYLALNDQERRFVIESLNQLRNKLIVDGKYTDAVDEVLIKIIGAKQKKFKVIFKEHSCNSVITPIEEKETSKILTALEEHQKELERMKLGSMAVVNQITTVSKQRIYIPKKSTDFLYGITLSTSAMDKINEKLKKLYIFE